MGDFFAQMQNEAGHPPQASPDDLKSPDEKTGLVQKASTNVEDSLAGGLAMANTHLEELVNEGGEVPDEAVPELQRMGQLMMELFQGQSPQAGGGGGMPPGAAPPGAGPVQPGQPAGAPVGPPI